MADFFHERLRTHSICVLHRTPGWSWFLQLIQERRSADERAGRPASPISRWRDRRNSGHH